MSLVIWPIAKDGQWSLAYDRGIKSQLLRLNTDHGVLLTLYSFEDLGEHMMVAHIKTFSNIEFEKKHPRMERPNVESTPYISTRYNRLMAQVAAYSSSRMQRLC